MPEDREAGEARVVGPGGRSEASEPGLQKLDNLVAASEFLAQVAHLGAQLAELDGARQPAPGNPKDTIAGRRMRRTSDDGS